MTAEFVEDSYIKDLPNGRQFDYVRPFPQRKKSRESWIPHFMENAFAGVFMWDRILHLFISAIINKFLFNG